jgi:hypothetical protein
MLELIALAATGAASFFGYTRSRDFTRRRLAYVDAVHRGGVPIIAAVAATAIAAPVAWVVPIIGTGTALFFGASVGLGVAAGRRNARNPRLTA